jgi:eukaryotic-like serine/threonine-protein kinase
MADTALIQLGRYRIVAELGRGAMGVVYRAEDPLLNRTVAIKTIIMSADPEERAEYEARFYQEAKAAGGLNHPNLITIHDIGREGEIAYMAMELLEGVELRDMMKRGRLPLPRALEIAAQVADGLAYAHERGVVHRDIKPGNIMIVRERHAKIMDFGIARMRISDIKTQAGAILGSPKYMSPEQVTGQRADHRSDIFSLGVVLYELVAGEAPFSAPHVTQLMHQVATATPRPPSSVNPLAPAMLDLIVAKALEKEPDARYPNAAELGADLRALLAELPEEQSSPPAAVAATPALDLNLAGTAMPGADGEKTAVLAEEGAKTRPREADEAKTVTSATATRAADAGTHLLLSRRFDSSEAVRRLAELAAAGGGADDTQITGLRTSAGVRSGSVADRARTALRRLRQDPARQAFAAAVIAAIAVALVIAFL